MTDGPELIPGSQCSVKLGPLADEIKLCTQPRFERFDQRLALIAAGAATLSGGMSSYRFLDQVQRANAFQRFAGDRRWARDPVAWVARAAG